MADTRFADQARSLSRLARSAATLPHPEGAELGIVLPGTLAPTDKWVDETTLIVFDGDAFAVSFRP